MILSSPDPALDPYVAAMLIKLQHEAYAIEAALIGDDRIPSLHEDTEALAAPRGRWCTAWDGVELLGAASWHEHEGHIDIDRLMVSPSALRRGIATALLAHVRERSGARDLVISTPRDNSPAVSLCAKNGFEAVGDEQVPPGIWITRFRRTGSASGLLQA
jgi:GNAT superfamily N-acetyltransferase